jgi:hypothetical protein
MKLWKVIAATLAVGCGRRGVVRNTRRSQHKQRLFVQVISTTAHSLIDRIGRRRETSLRAFCLGMNHLIPRPAMLDDWIMAAW